jgi:hypothetical protein
MKKIIVIIILLVLIGTSFSVIGTKEDCIINDKIHRYSIKKIINVNNNGDRVDQEQNNVAQYDNNNSSGVGICIGEFAQSFIPTIPILTRVELCITSRGNPEDLYISIRDDLDGEDLTNTNLNGRLYENLSWVFFDFQDITVNPGQLYFIIWHPIHNTQEDIYFWHHGSNNPYEKGKPWWKFKTTWHCFEDYFIEFPKIDFCFRTYGYSEPPSNPEITGATSGEPGTQYKYNVVSIDPDGDKIFYYIDWQDGNIQEWAGPYNSNVTQTFTHTWDEQGEYSVRAKAKDQYDFESEWTTLEISLPKNKQINNPILQFLENHLHLFPILRHILNL